MDVKHEPLRIKHPKHVRVPSEGRYDEDQEDHGPLPDQDTDAQQHAQDVPQQEEPAGGVVPHEGRDASLLACLPLPSGRCSGHLQA